MEMDILTCIDIWHSNLMAKKFDCFFFILSQHRKNEFYPKNECFLVPTAHLSV